MTAPGPVSRRAMAAHDHPWGAYRMALAVAPLTGCRLEDLRAGLATLIRQDPGCHALQRLVWREHAWEQVPEPDISTHVTQLATAYGGRSTTPEGVCEELLAEPVDSLPFRAVLGADFLALRINHVLGDSVAVEVLLPWLASLASGAVPVPLARTQVTERPYTAALRETFGRKVPVRALVETGRFIRESRSVRRRVDETVQPWAGDPIRLETASTGPAGAALLQRWRRQNCPQVSPGVVLITTAWSALERSGLLQPDDMPWIMVDLRRYLPRGLHVDGNFANAVHLPPTTPRTVTGVKDALAASVSSGVPLIAAAAQAGMTVARHTVRTRLGGAAGGVPALTVGPGREVVITINGRHRRYDDMPWSGKQLVAVEGPTVDSARGLTFCICQLKDGYHLTVGFYDSGVSRASVRLALDEFTDNLADLLEKIRGV